MRVRVQLDRQSRRWSWTSAPAEDSPSERSPTEFSTAQAAILDAQERFSPGLSVIIRGARAARARTARTCI